MREAIKGMLMTGACVLRCALAPVIAVLFVLGAQGNLVDFDVHDANRTLHLAWSAYCNESALRAWDCAWCTGPFAAQHVSIFGYLKDKKAGTQGYVGIDHELTRIVVAYRGSKDFQNTIQVTSSTTTLALPRLLKLLVVGYEVLDDDASG